MAFDVPPIGAHWKTTAQSALTVLIGLSAIAPQISFLSPKQSAALMSAGAIAKIFIGLLQKDAGSMEATTKSGEVKAVPSHEIPDDPTAKPITKES